MCLWVLVLSDCGKVLPISVTASLRLSVSVRLCPSLSHISFIKWQHDICKWNFPSTHLAAAAVVVVAAAAVGVAAAAAAIAAIDSQTDRLTFKQHSALHLHLWPSLPALLNYHPSRSYFVVHLDAPSNFVFSARVFMGRSTLPRECCILFGFLASTIATILFVINQCWPAFEVARKA